MRQLHKHLINNPIIVSAIFTLLAIVLLIPIVVYASGPTFTEYTLSDGTSNPTSIVAGPDGSLWFTEMGNNTIGKISTTGKISEYTIPLNGVTSNGPSGITIGPDGNLWFTEELSDRIGEISPSTYQITQYQLPNNLSKPSSIVAGPDKNMWFTLFGSDNIGVMSTSGTLLHQYPSDAGGPVGISVGPDGNIWYALQNTSQFGRFIPSQGIIEAIVGVASWGGVVEDTAPGPDGSVWYTINNAKYVGKINPSTLVLTQYTTPTASSNPVDIVAGPDGNMWFTEANCGLATVNISNGSISEYATPTTGLYGITKGPDNNIWYTVSDNFSRIGKAIIGTPVSGSSCSTSTTPPSSGTTGTGSSGSSGTSGSSASSSSGSTSGGGTNSSGSAGTPPVTLPPSPTGGSTGAQGDVIKTIVKNGVTIATVDPGINLAHYSYVVPDKQLLYVDGVLGQVIVKKGATLKGGGVIMELTVETGGTLAPGHSPGCITSNDLTLSGTYTAQIEGLTPCSGYDQAKVNNQVTLSGLLSVTAISGFNPQPGQVFTIIKNDSKGPINGTFTDLPEGAIFTSQGVYYKISYVGGTGHDVTITVVNVNARKSPVGASIDLNRPLKRSGGISKYIPELVAAMILLFLAAVFAYMHFNKKISNKIIPSNPVTPSIG